MIAKIFFKTGQYLRNPNLKKSFDFLKKSETWSIDKIKEYQLNKLQELLKLAYNHSSYYNKSFDLAGIKPSDIKSLEDLYKIPIVTKKDLINYNENVHSHIYFKKIFKASTSGSSGESLNFIREEEADSFNRASIFRGYSWYNVNPWERNGYFWGFNFSRIEKFKIRILDVLQNRFRLFSYESKLFFLFTKKLSKATYLHGYSSMIYEIAKLINSQKLLKPLKLKMVKGTSEKIYDVYQKEVIKAYSSKLISEYGAAETGIVAFECPKGNMHLNMEGVIVEEIDNEIVVTNLQMHSFPIIRYKLGDYIKLANKTKICSCGMKHQILEEVTGRVGDIVYGFKSTYPSLYFYYIFKNLVTAYLLKLNYQIVQNEKGKLVFFIEQNIDNKSLDLLKNEITAYFKNDILVEIKLGQKINSNEQKQKSFISNIK